MNAPSGEHNSEATARLMRQANKNGDMHADQKLQWAEDFERVSRHLVRARSVNVDTRSVFWVRLQGVLCELFDDDPKFRALIDLSAVTDMTARRYAAARAACEAIHAALTDDEHVFADYMRHVQCHVLQRGFELRPSHNKDGKVVGVRERHEIASLKRVMTVDEIQEAIARLDIGVRKKVTEHGFAVVLARRLLPLAANLSEAMRRINYPAHLG